ncbi:MAG: XRE family transcriptional regulator [Deltaproteobacteria bacterium]|nr:XRE family transcriptional regulator [Deltaproteobacteria bacterium]
MSEDEVTTTAASPEEFRARIAGNIKELRQAAGLSLGELAQEAGIGKSTLHALESGTANPSIETLWSVANALDVGFGRLAEPRKMRVQVVPAGTGPRLDATDSSMIAELLVNRRRRFDLWVIELQPEKPRDSGAHATGTYEHLLVLSGRVLAGPSDELVELQTGDLASYEADIEHHYEALEPNTRCVLLMDYR